MTLKYESVKESTSHIVMTHTFGIPHEMYTGAMHMGEMYMKTHKSSARAKYLAHLTIDVKVYFIQSHVMNARVRYNATVHCMRGT